MFAAIDRRWLLGGWVLVAACGGAPPSHAPSQAVGTSIRVLPPPLGAGGAPPETAAPVAPPEPVATVGSLPYVLTPVPVTPSSPPLPIVLAIHGTAANDVWLVGSASRADDLSTSHLFHSDGRTVQLIQRDVCATSENYFPPTYTQLRAFRDRVELEGTTPGANQRFLASATRRSNGAWSCGPSGTPSGWEVERFWSGGEAFGVWFTSDTIGWLDASGGSLGIDFFHGSGLPQAVAILPGGRHAWLVSDGRSERASSSLYEWSGVRWRARKDVLPAGVMPADIFALSATASGAYWGLTSTRLLRYDGARFLALPLPVGFSLGALLATDADGVWVFAPHRVWRFYDGAWQTAPLLVDQVDAQWLAPNGELWLAGSTFTADPEPKLESVVVARLVPQRAPKGGG